MHFCQAQPQLQFKLSLKAELALIPGNPAPPPPGKVSFPTLLEEDLNILVNGRRPQFLAKWKTTSILGGNGRRPQFLGKWKTTPFFWQMEDDRNL